MCCTAGISGFVLLIQYLLLVIWLQSALYIGAWMEYNSASDKLEVVEVR